MFRCYVVTLRLVCWALLLNLFLIPIASAQFMVGPGPDCDFHTVQAAVNASVGASPPIHLVVGTYPPFDTTAKVIEVDGGFPDCNKNSIATPGAKSVISGAGFLQTSVITVRPNSANNVILNLHDLEITNGNVVSPQGNGNGGGISFRGHGEIDLTNVVIDNNFANNGGAIDVNPDQKTTRVGLDGTTVVSLSGVTISRNRANFDGGGIRIQGPTHLFMLQDSLSGNSVIINNASGVNVDGTVENTGDLGGGIDVEGFAIADISVTQNVFGGTIVGNQASNGGGIATRNGGIVRLFTTIPNQQVTILEISARNHGGGIYSTGRAQVCAFGYNISLNTAVNGGAIYTDSDGAGAEFLFNDLDDPTRCAVPHWVDTQLPTSAVYPTFQNEIEANTTTQGDGATIFFAHNTTFDTIGIRGELVHIALNTAGEVIKTQSPGVTSTLLTNCLIDTNFPRHELIHSESDFVMDGCTVASNVIPFGTPMLRTTSPVTIRHSIIWQPAINTFNADFTKALALTDSIVPDANAIGSAGFTLVQFFGVRTADPLFVSTGQFNGNYRLRAGSPAIDYANTTAPQTNPNATGPTDLAGHLRCGVTLTDIDTRCDIGAYERQTPAPPITFPPDETFDEVSGLEEPAGILPAGWTSQNIAGTKNDWVTAGSLAFVGDPETVSDNVLVTPAFTVTANARLSFTQLLSLETCCDGVVLEIAIGGGAFTDILAAGGHFVSGGYNDIVGGGNPIAGRSVWNGLSADFQNVVVDLPTAANGQSVQLRWRLTSDGKNVGEQDGYFLDTIHVDLNRPGPDEIFKNGFQAPPAI
jgi:hypothetical protein